MSGLYPMEISAVLISNKVSVASLDNKGSCQASLVHTAEYVQTEQNSFLVFQSVFLNLNPNE